MLAQATIKVQQARTNLPPVRREAGPVAGPIGSHGHGPVAQASQVKPS